MIIYTTTSSTMSLYFTVLQFPFNCCYLLRCVDFDFSIVDVFFESGSEPYITTKGILLVDKGGDVVKLFEKLVDLKLCEPNEVTME